MSSVRWISGILIAASTAGAGSRPISAKRPNNLLEISVQRLLLVNLNVFIVFSDSLLRVCSDFRALGQ